MSLNVTDGFAAIADRSIVAEMWSCLIVLPDVEELVRTAGGDSDG